MQNLEFETLVKTHSSFREMSGFERDIFELIKAKTEEEFKEQGKLLGEKYRFNFFACLESSSGDSYRFELKKDKSLLPCKIYTYFKLKNKVAASDPEIIIDYTVSDSFLTRISVQKTYENKFKVWFSNAVKCEDSLENLILAVNNSFLKDIRQEIRYYFKYEKKETFFSLFEKSYRAIIRAFMATYESFEIKDNKIIFKYKTTPKELHSSLIKELSFDWNSGFAKIEFLNGSKETFSAKTETILRKEPLVDGKQHCETGPAKTLFKWDDNIKNFTPVEEHYFLDGKWFRSKQDWQAAVQKIKETRPAVFEAGLTDRSTVARVAEPETPIQTTEKEKTTMSKILDTAKKDGREVAKRVIVTKTVEATTSALAGLISPGNDKKAASTRKSVEEALRTPAGKAVVSFLMGAAIPVIEDRIPEKYRSVAMEAGQEGRVQGEVVLAEMVLEQLAKPAMKAALGGIQSSLDKVIESESTEIRAELPVTKATPELSEVSVEAAKASLSNKKKTE